MSGDMDGRFRELRAVPRLVGVIWLAVVLTFVFDPSARKIGWRFLSFLLTLGLGHAMNSDQTYKPRGIFLFRGFSGAGLVVLGGLLTLSSNKLEVWVGAVTILMGGWLLLDTVVVNQMASENGIDLFATNPVSREQLRDFESTLEDAHRPLTVKELTERYSLRESTVRIGLAVLLVKGRIEVRADGIEPRHLVVGRRFEGGDFLGLLLRPCRLATIGPATPSRQA